MRLTEIIPVYVETVPSELEEGKLYISKTYKCAIHLCACGCRQKTVTPVKQGEWTLTETGTADSILCTLRPSIGNFAGETTYHAHYYITNNKIEWL